MSKEAVAAAAPRRTRRTLAPGTVLENRYEILRIAGQGGMSTVYAARDLRFGQVERLCAIKEMFDVDPDVRDRALRLVNFERESAILATLSHPAIPKIYDYFIQGGLVYLVLEFIVGRDLEHYMSDRRAPCEEEQIINWALEIADVLETLHSQKPDPIIFRDLKPSNIMLRQSGQLVLIDFGIARTIQGKQRGTMIGTQGYAPPEQYRGIADARGDIYALGATLHHLATNSDPLIETPFTFHERPIQKLNPLISDELSAAIMKTLAYNPVDRYQSVSDLREDLLRVRNDRAAAAYGLSAGVLPNVAAADVDVRISHATHDEGPATERGAQRPRRLARQVAPKKRAARRKRDSGADIGERLRWATTTGDEIRGSAAFDGLSFVIGSYDSHLYSVAAKDGAVRWRFRTGRGIVTRPVMFENSAIFGSEDHTVYSIDRTTCAINWTFRSGMPVRSSPLVVGDIVVFGSDDGWIYAVNAHSGSLTWRHRTWGPVRSSPTATGDTVMVGSDDSHVYCLRQDSGVLVWRASCGGSIQSAPVVSGERVLATSRGGFVSALAVDSGERVWYHDARVPVLSSPRTVGGTVVFGAVDGSAVGLSEVDGSVRWAATYGTQITATATLAGEYGYLGTVDGSLISFVIATGEIRWQQALGSGIVSTPAYGSGYLVVGTIDGRICGLALTNAESNALEKDEY